jgi:hypothetical protein
MRPSLRSSVIVALLGLAVGAADLAPPSSPGPAPQSASPALPPAPPTLPARATSTVESLRQLLAMSETERDAALAQKSSHQQSLIRQELLALNRLDPAGRENRLRLIELRIILDPLVKLPPSARAAALAGLSSAQRSFVDDQLAAWDALSADQRSQLLATHRGWVPLPPVTPNRAISSEKEVPPPLPDPGFRSRVELDLTRWGSLEDQARTNAARALVRFFELPAKDRRAVLARLDSGRRLQVERMLESFGTLDTATRSHTIDAFLRFAAMLPEERGRFWQNADRWDSMTPEERRAWRVLTAHLPPLPPGLGPSPALPPRPPGVTPSLEATNGQAAR